MYSCNNVDKAFYTYHKKNKLMTIVITMADNFLLSYKDEAVQDKFFASTMATLNITTPSDQDKLTSLSLRLYQP